MSKNNTEMSLGHFNLIIRHSQEDNQNFFDDSSGTRLMRVQLKAL